MPPVPKLARLPADVRREFHALVRSEGYGSVDWLSAWLKERGHSVGKSAVHDYIQKHRADIEQEAAPSPDEFDQLRAARLEVRLRVLEAAAVAGGDDDVLDRADRLLAWVTKV